MASILLKFRYLFSCAACLEAAEVFAVDPECYWEAFEFETPLI